MQVKDIMVKNVVSVGPDDAVSQALAKMKRYKINQLLVANNNELYGMIELRRVATKDVNPAEIKVSNIATNVAVIDANASIESLVEMLLKSGLRALPVTEGGQLKGIVSETDIMNVAEHFVKGLNMKVSEIITPAIYVGKNDNIGTVKMLMLNNNISRVPVVEGDNIVGIIDALDMIRVLEGKEQMSARGGRLKEQGAKEKINVERTHAEAIMRSPTVIKGDQSISNVIGLLKKNEEVIVQHGETVGVITPKDILELFVASPKKQVFVQITGMQNESIEFKATMDKTVNEFVNKMGKMIENIEFLFLHVNKMEKGGKRDLYSIRARFKVPFGLFVAHASGWKPNDVIQDVMKKLEREVLKKHSKMEDIKRSRKQKYRYA